MDKSFFSVLVLELQSTDCEVLRMYADYMFLLLKHNFTGLRGLFVLVN